MKTFKEIRGTDTEDLTESRYFAEVLLLGMDSVLEMRVRRLRWNSILQRMH